MHAGHCQKVVGRGGVYNVPVLKATYLLTVETCESSITEPRLLTEWRRDVGITLRYLLKIAPSCIGVSSSAENLQSR